MGQEESWETLKIEVADKVYHNEAAQCFKTCIKWAQQNSESISNILLLSEMKKGRNSASRKHEAVKNHKLFFTSTSNLRSFIIV